jgi:hypothetical protein
MSGSLEEDFAEAEVSFASEKYSSVMSPACFPSGERTFAIAVGISSIRLRSHRSSKSSRRL